MSSAFPALVSNVSPQSTAGKPAGTTMERGAAARKLDLWWRYRDRDVTIDQGLYLKLPSADERLVVRDHEGNLQPLPEDAPPGCEFLVEGRTTLRLGELARLIGEWLTLSMRRFYLRAPSGRVLELSPDHVVRPDVLIRRLDAFLSDGAGPYRVLAVALRPEGENLD